MPQPSSETGSASSRIPTFGEGPSLEYATVTDAADRTIHIRARRVYEASLTTVFAAWTRRHAWESWLRLRARSRALLVPSRGGAFRLELAEGPTIHVITGAIRELDAPHFLSLTWWRHDNSDSGSLIEVALRDLQGATELTFLHAHIGRRQDAAWHMRLWSTALDRLGDYLAEGGEPTRRRRATPSLVASADHGLRHQGTSARYAQSA